MACCIRPLQLIYVECDKKQLNVCCPSLKHQTVGWFISTSRVGLACVASYATWGQLQCALLQSVAKLKEQCAAVDEALHNAAEEVHVVCVGTGRKGKRSWIGQLQCKRLYSHHVRQLVARVLVVQWQTPGVRNGNNEALSLAACRTRACSSRTRSAPC
jgi:hypothetical protein